MTDISAILVLTRTQIDSVLQQSILFRYLTRKPARQMFMGKHFCTILIFGYCSVLVPCVCMLSFSHFLFFLINVLYKMDSYWGWVYMYVLHLSKIPTEDYFV